MIFDLSAITTPDAIDLWAERIFAGPPAPEGVLHVMAVARRAQGDLAALALGDGAPRCDEDRFALALARARADALLTTGAIVRQEPGLHHGSRALTASLPASLAAAFAAWRQRGGRRRPATTVIMTRSRDLDLDHPLFADGGPVIVFTGADAPTRFGIDLARRGAMLISDSHPSLARCLARLAQAGLAAVTVEAGASVARGLYQPPYAVDELLLSTLEPEALEPGQTRGILLREDQLNARLRPVAPAYETRTEAGLWRLRRWRR